MATGRTTGPDRLLPFPALAGLVVLGLLALVPILAGLSGMPTPALTASPTIATTAGRSVASSPEASIPGSAQPSAVPSGATLDDPLLEGLLTAADLPGLVSPAGPQEGTDYDIDHAAFDANGGSRIVSQTWQSLADTGLAAVFDIRMQLPSDTAAAAYLDAAEPILSEAATNGQSPIPSAPVIGEDGRVYGLERASDNGTVLLRTYLIRVGPVVAKIVAGGPGVTAETTDAIAAAAAGHMRDAGPPAPGRPGPADSPSPAPTPTPPLPTGDALAELLLEHVPPEIAPTCVPDTQRLWPGELATLVCTDDAQDVTVTYSGFDSVTSLEAAYDSSIQGIDLTQIASSCDQGAFTGPYEVDDVEVGRVTCWAEQGGRAIMWSDDRLPALSVAVSPTLDAAGLYLWWLGAGPVP